MRLNARAPIVIRGDEITHLDADGYKHLPRAASLPDGKILASSGGAWRPSDLSGVSVSSVFGRTGAVTAQTGDYTPEQVGAAPAVHTHAYIPTSQKGSANGVAELGADGRVPSGQLPSYVDDVVEVANFAALPGTGEAGKIYITLDENKTWRWSGSGYAEISASLALGGTASTAHRGDHGVIAYAHSQATGNPHATTPSDIGAAPVLAYFDTVDADDINGGEPGLYTFFATSFVNFWPGISSGRASMIQLEAPTGLTAQLGIDNETGGWYTRFQLQVLSGAWSPWFSMWDSGQLPVSSFMKTVLDDANAGAARATLGAAPLAGAEVLIHSDFGRSATTDVWQSAFTDNTAAGLQLAANSIASGTEIIIEQAVVIPADASGATYQFYIGPQLTGEDAPSGSTYAIVLDPNEAGGYGQGIVRIECELIGSGSSITGYVTSTFYNNSWYQPTVKFGTITVNGTIANSIDVRFNPQSVTSYIIRRNRVRRCNP